MIALLIFGLLFFLYGLVSKRVEKTILTGPIIFAVAGILVGFSLPTHQQITFETSTFTSLGKIALALVLFTDATRIWVRDLIRSTSIPGRLLFIGMPLTILLGAAIAVVMFTELNFFEAAIIATILAPTDAGLGKVIVHSKRVPVRVRQALNVEAGLNDGLALPILMLFIALARVEEPLSEGSWIAYAFQQIGFGLLVGTAFGLVGGWLLRKALGRGWINAAFQQLCLLSLMVVTFVISDNFGGNEFIAVFSAGLAVKVGFEDAGEEMLEFSEAWGELLNFLVFFLFGMVAAARLPKAGGTIWLYAVLSLTIVRMLPVAVALIGSKIHRETTVFLGWFGPRGLASIALGLIFIKQEANLPGQVLITDITSVVVMLSILAHGISAAPGINWYSSAVSSYPPEAEENQTSSRNQLRPHS